MGTRVQSSENACVYFLVGEMKLSITLYDVTSKNQTGSTDLSLIKHIILVINIRDRAMLDKHFKCVINIRDRHY
jgi:hypothetical protein